MTILSVMFHDGFIFTKVSEDFDMTYQLANQTR